MVGRRCPCPYIAVPYFSHYSVWPRFPSSSDFGGFSSERRPTLLGTIYFLARPPVPSTFPFESLFPLFSFFFLKLNAFFEWEGRIRPLWTRSPPMEDLTFFNTPFYVFLPGIPLPFLNFHFSPFFGGRS